MSEYDDPESCNKCGGKNKVKVTVYDHDQHVMCEARTECEGCGFSDYWAYGFYESGSEIESKCKKYSFKH